LLDFGDEAFQHGFYREFALKTPGPGEGFGPFLSDADQDVPGGAVFLDRTVTEADTFHRRPDFSDGDRLGKVDPQEESAREVDALTEAFRPQQYEAGDDEEEGHEEEKGSVPHEVDVKRRPFVSLAHALPSMPQPPFHPEGSRVWDSTAVGQCGSVAISNDVLPVTRHS